jgi:hypothetical protein
MSMCLYIARGPEAQLRDIAEDAETLCGLGMATIGGGGLAGSGLARGGPAGNALAGAGNLLASLANNDEKLARMGELLERQPQLRQVVGDLLSRIGAQPASSAAGPAAAAADVRTLLAAMGPGGALSGAGRGNGGAGLGAAFGAASGGRGGAGAAPPLAPRAPAGPAPARPPVVDLHKSWHMFHFLFTGRASGGTPPASLLMEGGEEIGEDLGYGPARLLDPAATAALAAFVAPLTVDELKRRLDGERMAALSIYPAFDATDAAEEYGEDVQHYFPLLRDHFAAAAAAREATLVWLS